MFSQKIFNDMINNFNIKPIDLYCLISNHQTIIKKDFKAMMLKRLEGKVHNPEEFCKWLKKTGAVMCGSFPLQVMLDETWDDSDIDIYVMNKENEQVPKKMCVSDSTHSEVVSVPLDSTHSEVVSEKRIIQLEQTKNYLTYLLTQTTTQAGINWDKVLKNPIGKTIFTKVLDTVVLCSSVNYYSKFTCLLKFGLKERAYWGRTEYNKYDTSLITSIGNFQYSSIKPCQSCAKYTVQVYCKNECAKKHKNITIQIIKLNPKLNKSIKEFVGKFDLDFCKVMFDGEDFTILEPKSLLTRTSTYNKILDWHIQKNKRVAKYIKRGFTITEPQITIPVPGDHKTITEK